MSESGRACWEISKSAWHFRFGVRRRNAGTRYIFPELPGNMYHVPVFRAFYFVVSWMPPEAAFWDFRKNARLEGRLAKRFSAGSEANFERARSARESVSRATEGKALRQATRKPAQRENSNRARNNGKVRRAACDAAAAARTPSSGNRAVQFTPAAFPES